MARRGRAGAALGISAIGSFVGGTVSIVGLMFLAFLLADVAVKFGPPEFFSVMVLGLVLLTYLASGSIVDALIMVALGMILGTIGLDPVSGMPRFTFGTTFLLDGVGLVPVAMGLFGVSEVLMNIAEPEERSVLNEKIRHLWPTGEDFKKCLGPVSRGSVLGFLTGILPGGGAVMSTFLSYTMEKKLSKHPEEFGRGAIEGVAGPETANNAASGGAFVPMLALGIPPNALMALLLAALMVHGVTPGPLLMTQHPEVFWGVIASMYVGNAMLVVLNLPLVGLWVKILKIPYRVLMPLILLCCLIGAYATGNNHIDIAVMVFFGLIGYVLRRLGFELAPLILALVLGPLMEINFRNALTISDGSLMVFITKPISATLLVISALLLVSAGFSAFRKAKGRMIEETGGGD
jgi:putative tricarboxylic transport membrane protein